MEIQGVITQLKARVNASGDNIQTITIEAHGDFAKLHEFLKEPLRITIEKE